MADDPDALDQIGAVLAAAADGASAALSESQRAALARMSIADTLFAITQRIDLGLKRGTSKRDPSFAVNSLRRINEELAPIAAVWANECRAAFDDLSTQQRITAALATDQPLALIAHFIREDDRLASYERDAILEVLDGAYGKRRATRGSADLPKTAYLSQLSVAGFRGIGQPAAINVAPHPGLTIVYGANGSGKSSFAEALDVLLTGTTGRFAGRGVEWRSAQTNVHNPQIGFVRAVFSFGAQETDIEPFVRSWTDNGYLTGTYNETPLEKMRAIGWLDALEEFRPILGYAELGPLLDEETFDEATASDLAGQRETQLARHIRLRTGISDPLLSSIQQAVQTNGDTIGQPFLQELAAWYRLGLSRGRRGALSFATNDGLSLTVPPEWRAGLTALVPSQSQSLPHPRELRWDAFFAHMRTERVFQRRNRWHSSTNARFAQYLVAPLLDLCRDYTTDEQRSILTPQATVSGWTSRTHVYCEMLIDAIYRARLATLSQQIKTAWEKIRPGSSVQFHGIALRNVSQANQVPVFRASLDLSLDGVRGVERGVLSQGELHSMALSVFLPTMMRPESPFGFAVIDDPVQVMDQHAVDGLAEVLRDAAEDLQLIVFTHDSRLLRALNVLNADYTRIDVTRSGSSVVECKIVGDPVMDKIKNARIAADRVDDLEWQRQDVALQCRLAIEAACLPMVRAGLAARRSAERAEDTIERLTSGTTTAKDLMVRAIFGSSQQAKRARDKGTYWDDRVEGTLDIINKLVHAVFEEEADAAYGGDLHDLIDDVEYVLSVIKAHRG